MLALATDLWSSWVREHFEVFFPGGQLVLMVWILVYLDLFLSCHSLWIKEERFAMEIAQSQLELNTLRDNCKLPWLINVNIIWCIISNFMWILPRNLVYVLEDSKRGVLIQFDTQIFRKIHTFSKQLVLNFQFQMERSCTMGEGQAVNHLLTRI